MAHTLFKLFLTQRLAVLASTESLRAIREDCCGSCRACWCPPVS